MADAKSKGRIVLLGFVIYVVVTAQYWELIATQIATNENPLYAWLFYIIAVPAYLVVAYAFVKAFKTTHVWKDVLGGALVVFALDIVSAPRLVLSGPPTDLAGMANSDYVMWLVFNNLHFSYGLWYWTYYVILPIVLALLAFKLVGIIKFGNKMGAAA